MVSSHLIVKYRINKSIMENIKQYKNAKFEMIKEKKIKKKLGDIFTFLLSLWHSHISGFEFIGRIFNHMLSL